MVGWYPIYFRHGLSGLVDLTMTVVESRCFGKGQYTDSEDSGRNEGESEGDLPRCCFSGLMAFCSVVEDCGQEDTECDEELVGGDQSSADVSRCGLRLSVVSRAHLWFGDRYTWYMGTSKLSAPTPRPATNLPIMT